MATQQDKVSLTERERMILGAMFDAYCAECQTQYKQDPDAQGAMSSLAMSMAEAQRLVEKLSGTSLNGGN
jgi:hypothetical protein